MQTRPAAPAADEMARDTLIFRAGILARIALGLAFRQPQMHAVYAAWLCAPVPKAATAERAECQTLLEAGLEHGGRVELRARKQPTEFVVSFEHGEFQAVVCVAYEPSSARVNALHLIHFTGQLPLALGWLDAAATELGKIPEPAAPAGRARPVQRVRSRLPN
jgi:hypothetical protein